MDKQHTRKKSPYFNKTQIKDRGWTDTAITKFLGSPDLRGKNRAGRKGKVSLYLIERVERVESTSAFRDYQAKSRARRASALQSAQRKRSETLAKVKSRLDSIHLSDDAVGLSRAELRKKASDSFLEIENRRAQRRRGYEPEKITSRRTEAFFSRIEVNWLRHEGTVYDDELKEYFNETGVGQAVDMVREHVYGLIAQAYPHLADECDKQLDKRRKKEARKRGQDVTNRTTQVVRTRRYSPV